MLRKIKNKINNIYLDGTIPYNKKSKQFVDLLKQRVTKEDICSTKKLRNLQKKKHNSQKMRVVFLLQMPQVWEKQQLVYEEMKKRENIETIVLAIPEYDIRTKEFGENIAYEYAVKNNLSSIVCARQEDNWIDLEKLKPDYVFYQRPYEEYLPEAYRSRQVLNYARTCYIPYAIFVTVSGAMSLEYERGFARNIYYNFVGNKQIEDLVRRKFSYTTKRGFRKVDCLGLPIFENILKKKEEAKEINTWNEWGAREEQFKVLWTPRWTLDEKLGGSHFFVYKDHFSELSKANGDIFFVLRPHPLAFDHYIKCGLMSEMEVTQLKDIFEREQNMNLDLRKEYIHTFWNTDVLITDISSMVTEFFVTGKPIIFCGTKLALDSIHQEIVNSLYCCNNWEEIEATIELLKKGEDPLKEERNKNIKKHFKDVDKASEKIVDALECDYRISCM